MMVQLHGNQSFCFLETKYIVATTSNHKRLKRDLPITVINNYGVPTVVAIYREPHSHEVPIPILT